MAAKRLTDRQKKRIIADYVTLESFSAAGRKHGVSPHTVKRLVEADPAALKMCADKKKACDRDVMAYMDTQKDMICQIIGNGLKVLADPQKMAQAKPAEITTALGTLIDKWTAGRAAAPEPVKVEMGKELEDLAK